MSIPIEVAQKAKELPALTGEDLDEGEAWYKAILWKVWEGKPQTPEHIGVRPDLTNY